MKDERGLFMDSLSSYFGFLDVIKFLCLSIDFAFHWLKNFSSKGVFPSEFVNSFYICATSFDFNGLSGKRYEFKRVRIMHIFFESDFKDCRISLFYFIKDRAWRVLFPTAPSTTSPAP